MRRWRPLIRQDAGDFPDNHDLRRTAMSGAATTTPTPIQPAEFKQVLGHPAPLWMLFMTEFWERFAFYGIRWALVLYIVAQFHGGNRAGEADANLVYGSYLALVYAAAVFGGYVADRVIGYQRAILVGAAFMAAGLFAISYPDPDVFKIGLATIIVGNGMFKPNISTMVGQLYGPQDPRRDSGFTIFYMGINAGGFVAPLLTGYLAERLLGGTTDLPSYKVVFMATGVGMLLSLLWFQIGRRGLKGIGAASGALASPLRLAGTIVGSLVVIPVVWFLLKLGAEKLQGVLLVLFIILAIMLMVEGIREGKVARDKTVAMLVIFFFNVMFWCFFEQAGSSFTFLADKIVRRNFGDWIFPTGWFQSVNTLAIIVLAPVVAAVWVALGRYNPSIPRKFGLGLVFNGLAFLLLMFALQQLVGQDGKIPFWTLFMVYVVQSVGVGMGGWFLSVAIGNNLSGIFASFVSGTSGMTTGSALQGYTFGFWALLGSGVLLFLVAPLIQKLMHGVK
jgi:POT family proton-dependent oligopeptide transporter